MGGIVAAAVVDHHSDTFAVMVYTPPKKHRVALESLIECRFSSLLSEKSHPAVER